MIARPPREEIEARFSEIENLNLKNIGIDEIKDLLTLLFTGFNVNTPEWDAGIELFRGIPYNVKPETVSFLSYPPKEFAKENRASREQQPMFYCATMREVPFYELGVKPFDRLMKFLKI